MTMKNGYYHQTGAFHFRGVVCHALCLALALVSLPGCRSSRSNIRETRKEVSSAAKKYCETDTVSVSASVCEERADSAEISADRLSLISIKRDSAGRIVEIRSTSSADIKTNLQREIRGKLAEQKSSTKSYASASDSVDSVRKEIEKTKKEIETAPPVKSLIGLVAVIVVVWLWIRKRLR